MRIRWRARARCGQALKSQGICSRHIKLFGVLSEFPRVKGVEMGSSGSNPKIGLMCFEHKNRKLTQKFWSFRWASFGSHYCCTDQLDNQLNTVFSSSSLFESELTQGTVTAGLVTNTGRFLLVTRKGVDPEFGFRGLDPKNHKFDLQKELFLYTNSSLFLAFRQKNPVCLAVESIDSLSIKR